MKGREAFQEIDYRAMFGTVAKWAVEIDRVERIPEILARAWATALSGRPGPVVIALPEDMLSARTDAEPLKAPIHISEPAPDPADLARARDLLSRAARPLILIAGSNWSEPGRAALHSFAETSDIPVVAAFRFQDRFDNFSPVYAGEAGVGMPPHIKALVREADVILALNLRFGEMTTDGYTLLRVPVPDADPRPCLGPGTGQGLCAGSRHPCQPQCRGRGADAGIRPLGGLAGKGAAEL